MSDELEPVPGVSRVTENDNVDYDNNVNQMGVIETVAAVTHGTKRKAETEELALAVYNGNFDAWLDAQKKRWRRVRRARNTVRSLLSEVREQYRRVPPLEQLGEGLVRSAMLAQYERDLAKPPVMTTSNARVVVLDED
jgi:hypothetical protein